MRPFSPVHVWHLTPDAPRQPLGPRGSRSLALTIGTWPVGPEQTVRVDYRSRSTSRKLVAAWQRNKDANSYWRAEIGPLDDGELVEYTVVASSADGEVAAGPFRYRARPQLHLALIWHQHQPLYRDPTVPPARGSFRQPWTRLHALRDYYSMAAIVADHPEVRLTINLTPVLLAQIEDYARGEATDEALELTRKLAERLTEEERARVLDTFFDADLHGQIGAHQRYRELFALSSQHESLSSQELRDLQAWFSLAWFGIEFRRGPVTLVTGETASVRTWVDKGRGFSPADIDGIIEEQLKILRAVIPIHRQLQERRQIEVSTTPFYHPILPLLVDTDRATLDRPGTSLPGRFAHPEDAEAQVDLAIHSYERWFGRRPVGMWPAEGAVSRAVVPMFARRGVRWIATDRDVLARSGRWGYRADEAAVLARPYACREHTAELAILFRDPELSNDIGFHLAEIEDADAAARLWVERLKQRFADGLGASADDRLVTVVLDGENAWASYRDDGRPFLHALYRALGEDPDIATVTPAQYLDGDAARAVDPHPLASFERVHELYTGSWIDEPGSASGCDLGTWIGEPEENQAWNLLGRARRALATHAGGRAAAPRAYQAILAAEGSDWFWWYGDDQSSTQDDAFDEMFRGHLTCAYRALGEEPPAELERHIVSRRTVWTYARRFGSSFDRDLLVVRTSCPGILRWRVDGGPVSESPVLAVAGPLQGVHRHELALGTFDAGQRLAFEFACARHEACRQPLCSAGEQTIRIERPPERDPRVARPRSAAAGW